MPPSPSRALTHRAALARAAPVALVIALVSIALACAPALATPRSAGRAKAAAGPSVGAALQGLRRSGAIAPSAYQQYATIYNAAQRSLRRLSGTRRRELGAVLANVQAIAAAHGFTPTRLPALFLTLERNRQWWTTEPLLSGIVRVSFPGSKLVWQHYPGQGIEIQWLGTFGAANGFYLSGHENANLRQLLGEALPLATQRGDGIAWEYLFRFGGGLPPWTSGLSQGTALQVFARAWSRFKDPAYLTAAQQALGIFSKPPPVGVSVRGPAGTHYAQYTYAPGDRILNGFIQALVGLYDYTSLTGDPRGLALFEAGDSEARAEVPRYDTGAWSRYDQFSESTLNYHELVTEFLQHLCERTRKGPPLPTPAAPPPSTTPTTPPSSTPSGGTGTSTTTPGGGATASRLSARGRAAQGTPIAADAIYCTTARRFTGYLRAPPVIALLSTSLSGGRRAGVQISLSKLSTVSMTIRQGTRVVWTNRATLQGGRPRLLWVTPASGGTFGVTLTARDQAGNFATAQGTIVVRRP